MSAAHRPWALALAACLGLAALSALVGPATPTYDPWAWLIWGREIGHLELDTVDGPAFKPLPVLLAAVIAPLGDAAPEVLVVLARAGAFAAIAAAALLAHRLAGGPGIPADAYVLPAARRPRRRPRWWQVGLRLGWTVGRRWWAPRRRRREPTDGDGTSIPVEDPGPQPGRRDVVHRLAASRAALLATVAAATTTGLVWHSWTGGSEGWAAALALLALERAAAREHRAALACVVGVCLLRVEAWPAALLYVAYLASTRPAWRPALAAGVVIVPVLWFGPELWGSGDLLRSGARARIPNPGQPAEAAVPALASLGDAVTLPLLAALVAAVVGAATMRPGVGLPLAAGGAWLLVVAAMAQAGFSGEERYHVPGAVALGVAGAVALAGLARRRDPRWALLAAVLATLVAGQAAARAVGGVPDRWDRHEHQERLAGDLRRAIDRAGGPASLLRCGRPVTGRYRGPLVAWHLRVPKRRVGFDPAAQGTGAVLSSPLVQHAAVEPPVDRGRGRVVRAGLWTITLPRC